MLAVRISFSGPEKEMIRARHLEEHKHYLRSTAIKILRSGPLFGGDSSQTGAIVLAEVDDLAQMEEFSARDPFVIHGIYAAVHICEWKVTIENPT